MEMANTKMRKMTVVVRTKFEERRSRAVPERRVSMRMDEGRRLS